MRIRVKICGITELRAARAAVEAGADALGFVFAPGTRQVDLETTREICSALPALISRVGVFVNPTRNEVEKAVQECGLDAVQLHGEESPAFIRELLPRPVIKGIPVKDAGSLERAESYRGCSTLLLDAYHPDKKGGSGTPFNWALLEGFDPGGGFILAGGLESQNVSRTLEQVRPAGVDVSSGVETEGKKDPVKIEQFIKQVRRWEYHAKAISR